MRNLFIIIIAVSLQSCVSILHNPTTGETEYVEIMKNFEKPWWKIKVCDEQKVCTTFEGGADSTVIDSKFAAEITKQLKEINKFGKPTLPTQ